MHNIFVTISNLDPWLLLHYSIYLKSVTVPNDMFVKPIFLVF